MNEDPRHLYDPLGDSVYQPTRLAQGPWNPAHQSGVVLAALMTHGLECIAAPADMLMARVTLDLIRPTAFGPVEMRSRIVRDGRRQQMVEVELWAGGDMLTARGTGVRLRTAPSPATDEPPPPPPPLDAPSFLRPNAAMGAICEAKLLKGGLESPGPGSLWTRFDGDVVPDVPISPLVQTAMVADFGSGLSSFVDWREWTFANVDITLHLVRAPRPGWLKLDARTMSAGNGVGLVTSDLADDMGPFGQAHQTLFLDARSRT